MVWSDYWLSKFGLGFWSIWQECITLIAILQDIQFKVFEGLHFDPVGVPQAVILVRRLEVSSENFLKDLVVNEICCMELAQSTLKL